MAERTRWQRIAKRIRVPMGFLFAAVFLWLAQPSPALMLASLALVAPGLWLRGYAAGYVRKNAELTTTGPYAHTRNPLYLGSLLIGIGFAIAARSWWVGVALLAMFFAIYLPVIRSEEEFLRTKFPEFEEYAKQVPRLLPRLTPYSRGDSGGFSIELYLQHREYNALLGALAMTAALIVKMRIFKT